MNFFSMLMSGVATILTIVSFVPYIVDIWRNQTKPHVLSWTIWAMTTCVVGVAQWVAGAGWGAWPTLISGGITVGVAGLAAYRVDQVTITRWDWVLFGIALGMVPLWGLTHTPIWSVIVLTLVDVLGFIPTIRKSWHDPYSENLTMYGLMGIRNAFGIVSMESFTVTTLIFPTAMLAAILVTTPLIAWRRYHLKNQNPH